MTNNLAPAQQPTETDSLIASAHRRPPFDALSMARYVRRRRLQIGLTVAVAAALAGMELSQWDALEGGWIPPENDPRLHAIAETLEVCWAQIDLGAALTRAAASESAA